MRIAFFTDTYLPQLNGVSISIKETAGELRKRGHSVYIFAPKISTYKDSDKNIIRLNSFKVLSSEPEIMFPLPLLNKNYKKIMSLSFDIVHAHGNGAFSLLGHQVARLKGVPYVMTFHTLHTKYTHYFLKGRIISPKMVATALRIFGNRCDGVIAPSEKMKRELVKYGINKPIEIIPSLARIGSFGKESRGFLRKRLKIHKHLPIILSVGRLGKEKNFEFLIRVFSKINKKFPSSHLVIVGRGPEEKNLKQLILKFKLSKQVHLTKMISEMDMPRVYADAQVFLFASKTETQGLAVVEAAASGLPLVMIDDDAFGEITTPKNGFLLPPSQKSFVEKTSFLLKNPNIARKMGIESRRIVEKIYNQDIIIENLVNYYSFILKTTQIKKRRIAKIPAATLRVLESAQDTVERFFK